MDVINKVILDRDVKTELEKLPLFDLHIIDGIVL